MCWHSFTLDANVNGQPRNSNMKILIVDDDIISRMLLMHLISACGQRDIVEAEDGLDAWQQLERGLRPAILFCDVRMPRLSGIELLQRVKGDPALAAMPFVLVSAAHEQESVQQALAAGASGYIVKPFRDEGVRVNLRALLERAGG
jgi:two-component system chemotaxis response regulator CheY